MVRISDRLRTVAHMCDKGAVVADIGTDHGYLPIYLVQEGIAPEPAKMPVKATVKRTDKYDTILANIDAYDGTEKGQKVIE